MTQLAEETVPIDIETDAEDRGPTAAPGPISIRQVRDCDELTEKSDTGDHDNSDPQRRPRLRWTRVIAYGVLPAAAMILALAAGYLKWWDYSQRESHLAGIESVRAASDGAVAMLSYQPDTVETDLGAARDRLTGELKDSYTTLTHDVVVPGSKQKQISAAATVPAAASVSASPNRAIVLVFVNQTTIVGGDPPTNTASRVRVTLDKIGGRWLIAGFDPI